MTRMCMNIYLFLYYLFFTKLPNSAVPFGKYLNIVRVNLIKHILPVGNHCKIQKNVYFGSGKNISIGNNCQINDNVRLDNVHIGDNVMIGRDTIFLGKTHIYKDCTKPMIEQGQKTLNSTIIENDIWIGARVIIMPSINIAEGCIIGAGSILTKDTVAFGVYGGNPARLIKKRK